MKPAKFQKKTTKETEKKEKNNKKTREMLHTTITRKGKLLKKTKKVSKTL